MTLQVNHLTTGQESGSDPATTASVTPSDNAVLYLQVGGRVSTDETQTAEYTITGLGGTWELVIPAMKAAGRRTAAIYRCTDYQPGGGTITIDYTGAGSWNTTLWNLIEVTGGPKDFPERGISQSLGTIQAFSEPLALTIPRAPRLPAVQGEATIAFNWTNGDGTPAFNDTNWTQVGLRDTDALQTGMQALWNADGDSTPDIDSDDSDNGFAVGFILRTADSPYEQYPRDVELALGKEANNTAIGSFTSPAMSNRLLSGTGVPTTDDHTTHVNQHVLDVSAVGANWFQFDDPVPFPDQWAETYVLLDSSDSGNKFGVVLRGQNATLAADADVDGYSVYCYRTGATSGQYDVRITSVVDGAETQVASATAIVPANWDDGFHVFAEVRGGIIRVWTEGVLRITHDTSGDATVYASGDHVGGTADRNAGTSDSQPFHWGLTGGAVRPSGVRFIGSDDNSNYGAQTATLSVDHPTGDNGYILHTTENYDDVALPGPHHGSSQAFLDHFDYVGGVAPGAISTRQLFYEQWVTGEEDAAYVHDSNNTDFGTYGVTNRMLHFKGTRGRQASATSGYPDGVFVDDAGGGDHIVPGFTVDENGSMAVLLASSYNTAINTAAIEGEGWVEAGTSYDGGFAEVFVRPVDAGTYASFDTIYNDGDALFTVIVLAPEEPLQLLAKGILSPDTAGQPGFTAQTSEFVVQSGDLVLLHLGGTKNTNTLETNIFDLATKFSGTAVIGPVTEEIDVALPAQFRPAIGMQWFRVTTGGTLTLTLGFSGSNFGLNYQAYRVPGGLYDIANPIVGVVSATENDPGSGASDGATAALTLGVTPTADDLQVHMAVFDVDDAAYKHYDVGTGWQKADGFLGNTADYSWAAVSYRTGSTDTNVQAISDIKPAGSTGLHYYGYQLAFIVQAPQGVDWLLDATNMPNQTGAPGWTKVDTGAADIEIENGWLQNATNFFYARWRDDGPAPLVDDKIILGAVIEQLDIDANWWLICSWDDGNTEYNAFSFARSTGQVSPIVQGGSSGSNVSLDFPDLNDEVVCWVVYDRSNGDFEVYFDTNDDSGPPAGAGTLVLESNHADGNVGISFGDDTNFRVRKWYAGPYDAGFPPYTPLADSWPDIDVEFDAAWWANEAEASDGLLPADAEAVSKINLAAQSFGPEDDGDMDSTVAGCTFHLDHFSSGYHGADTSAQATFTDNSFDAETLGWSTAVIVEFPDVTSNGQIVRVNEGGAESNATRMTLLAEGGNLRVRTNLNVDILGAVSTNTPYLITAYWDPTTPGNSWVELNEVDQGWAGRAVPTGANNIDQFHWGGFGAQTADAIIHSIGVKAGEWTASEKTAMKSYFDSITGGGGGPTSHTHDQTDAVGVTDAIELAHDHVLTITDGVGISEAITPEQALLVVISDGFTVTDTITADLGALPDAIADLAGTPGDTLVVLTHSAPADNGSPITDYVFQYREVKS